MWDEKKLWSVEEGQGELNFNKRPTPAQLDEIDNFVPLSES